MNFSEKFFLILTLTTVLPSCNDTLTKSHQNHYLNENQTYADREILMQDVPMLFNALPDSDPLKARINSFFRDLNISIEFFDDRKLIAYPDETDLVFIEGTETSRSQQLTPHAAEAWNKMRAAALRDNVVLNLVSAFRSFDRQKQIIERKIKSGQSLKEIFEVSAPPGFSEHHTGRAVDIGTTNCNQLTSAFESTDAFRWLMRNAGTYGFHLSYSKDNEAGFAYEPWHWYFKGA